MKLNKTLLILLVPVILISVTVVYLLFKPEPANIRVGMIEAPETDIAVKIPGRLDSIFVSEGDVVSAGTRLGTMKSPELQAKANAAEDAWKAAKLKAQIAGKGARPEEIKAVEKLYEQASHQFELASKTWKRVQSVYSEGVMSTQERDQAEFQFNAARDQMEAAKAKSDMVKSGLRPEEVQAAEAMAAAAGEQYNEVKSYLDETQIQSPVAGEVTKIVADAGEMVAAGYPVFTVIDRSKSYVVINVRETDLALIKTGTQMPGRLPGLGGETVTFEVYSIAAAADYATWRSTQEKADFDLKTFEVRLKPVSKGIDFRPGMTVQLEWPE
ncbi:MAG: efflux RND transporter periplasmic adaptor subunit [Bacteroidetes bacterium]|nr:efflux RND transporter periplasmic adaptor subunit [Bacteroidota bacterium]